MCSCSRVRWFVQGEGAWVALRIGRVRLLHWETCNVVLRGLQLEIAWKLKMLT